jgi:hypothetical protein
LKKGGVSSWKVTLISTLKIYLDFDRAYLLCPKETLCVYGLDEEVDSYIDIKLKQYPPNP